MAIKCAVDDFDLLTACYHPSKQPCTLVLCFNGTASGYEKDNTNIVKLFSLLKKDDSSQQLCYYQAGIGAFFAPGVVSPLLEWVVKNTDQAVAWYLTKHIMYGYRFLIQNYHAEDRICMFVMTGTLQAFPKAHIQRVLWLVGLLPRDNQEQIPFAYQVVPRWDVTMPYYYSVAARGVREGMKHSVCIRSSLTICCIADFNRVWSSTHEVVCGFEMREYAMLLPVQIWKSITNTPPCNVIWSYLSHPIKQPLPTSVISAAALKKLVLIMQRQRYVALGGPHAGLYDSPPPLDYDRILPIAIKAGPDIADLLADLVELFPKHARPDQMARIIEHSDKVGEVSNEIKSKIYCVLDGKTAFGNVRMMFVTDNFKEVESFLNNGNTWKRETSLHKGLLYMLQDIQGAEPYVPIPSGSYRRKPSISPASDSRQPAPTPSSSSTTTGSMPSGSEITSLPNMQEAHEKPWEDCLHLPVVWPTKAFAQWPSLSTTESVFGISPVHVEGKGPGDFPNTRKSKLSPHRRERVKKDPKLQTQTVKLTLNWKSAFLGWRSGLILWGFNLKTIMRSKQINSQGCNLGDRLSMWIPTSGNRLLDLADLLSMGHSVHSLNPSWVESICKISADLSELHTDNDLDAVSRAKLRQAFSHRAEISHLMAYAEKGIYTSNNLSAIDDQVAKLPLTEAAFRKSLECTLVSLHVSFMSIDCLLPESDAAPSSLPSYLPELRMRLEETATTHRATRNLSIALSDLCILSMREKKSLEMQMTTHPLVFTWMRINSANAKAVLYAISFMENLSHEVCTGWKAAILVGKQVHQFLLILEQRMHHIVGDEDWTTDRSAGFHGMLAKGIMGVEDLYEDLAFTRQRGNLFS
ncbi:hypothetical protein IW261DRAFT_1426336 [Armillaria novae-zelandiae]|uniref:T6SS Phospholipase effector Tle1-like catalytic domain-containing protein n=1 Tax=Armillaria novae-zelandiae TaxID=153914 RepID=A0AA39TWI3_9AGAR|nr:hypothetical protein IW261DRAFT_1426336 [Armillaria novae-zelandiae]